MKGSNPIVPSSWSSANIDSSPVTGDNDNDTARHLDPVRGTHREFLVEYVTPRSGASLWRVVTKSDGSTQRQFAAEIPPLVARFTRGKGILYRFEIDDNTFLDVDGPDLRSGAIWDRAGVPVPKKVHEPVAFAVIQMAKTLPVTTLSPKVTEGTPPMAPPGLTPTTEDPEGARTATGRLGRRLGPDGRLLVGAALGTPWLKLAGGTSSVISVWGKGGDGKSLLGAFCASMWGDPASGVGLFRDMNSSEQGITSWAQELAYFPMVLDELQSATSDIQHQLVTLVMGANRSRADVTGASVHNPARWDGLVFTTSNAPIDTVLKSQEMFDRRLLTVDTQHLWAEVPTGTPAQVTEVWRTRAEDLDVIAGWPGHELFRQFPPGPEAARFLDHVRATELHTAGNLGTVLQLAITGCRWLAHWTGEQAWTAGVGNAAQRLVAERQEEITDPARDAADRIIMHRAQHAQDWTEDSRDRVAHLVTDKPEPCDAQHDQDCVWYHVPHAVFGELAGIDPRRLRGTMFERVSVRARRRLQGLGKVRGFTICIPGLAEVAVSGIPEYPTVDPADSFSDDDQLSLDSDIDRLFSDTPKSSDSLPGKGNPAPDDTEDDHAPGDLVYESITEDEATADALERARTGGITDLVTPNNAAWTPKAVEAAGWNLNGWTGQGTGPGTVERYGTKIRIHRVPSKKPGPDEVALAYADWDAWTGRSVIASIPRLATKIVREEGKDSRGHTPRWYLDADWWPEDIAHVQGWGNGTRAEVVGYWDRNRSHLPSITQATVAPLWQGEEYEHFADVPEPSSKQAGMVRITVPDWPMPLPAPTGPYEPGTDLWVTTEITRMFAELHAKFDTPMPIMHEAWLAPAHKVAALERFAKMIKEWLTEDRPGALVPKRMYQSFAGNIVAEHQKHRRWAIYRPDWGQAIRDNSWCAVIRQAYKVFAADPGWVPVGVNVDAICYDRDETPPGLPIGDGLGQFKREV